MATGVDWLVAGVETLVGASMRGFVRLTMLMVTGCLGTSGITGLAQGAVAPKPMEKEAVGSVALTVSPACPNITTYPVNHQSATEPITVRYDSKAKGALRSAKSLTLHVALLRMSQMGTVQDFPMTRQPNGTWLVSMTLTGSAVSSGHLMFDVENQDHHTDRNGGRYWDTQLCYLEPRTKLQMHSSASVSSKAQSYGGRMLAPGFQRAPNMRQSLAIMQEDFATQP
jgi:hypothetical protein